MKRTLNAFLLSLQIAGASWMLVGLLAGDWLTIGAGFAVSVAAFLLGAGGPESTSQTRRDRTHPRYEPPARVDQ